MLTVLSSWKLYYCVMSFLTESVAILDIIRIYFTTNFSKNSLLSKSFCSIFLGIPATSKHSLLEYWVLAQHWHSMFTSLLDNSKFTFFVTNNSDWKISNLLFNLRISSNASALLAEILDCIASTRAIKSFSSSLSKSSSVYDAVV